MVVISNLLLILQWVLFIGGLIGAPVLLYSHDFLHALISLAVSMSALSALKMEVFAFASPRR